MKHLRPLNKKAQRIGKLAAPAFTENAAENGISN